jgi:5-methylthioadenosine/S-adenosylhomocysteine deaminase
MSLAATIHSLRSGPTALDAWAALAMATRDGARALHLDHEVGTLSPGKAADLAVVALDAWSSMPGDDPASRLVHGGSARDVRHVVVDGRVVVRDGELQTANREALASRVLEAWQRTRTRMARS